MDEGRYIDYTVVDRNDEKVGTVESVWLDGAGEPAYLSVRTGWLGMGRSHVVPAQNAHVSERRQHIRLPYTLEQIRSAPEFDSSLQLQSADEESIGSYYGNHGFRREGWLASHGTEGAQDVRAENVAENRRIQLKDEELKVGKREVEAGGVRLRKVVRTEVVNQPVELQREEIVIERVPAGERAGAEAASFDEEEIYVPLRREEAVVSKEARVREEVRVGKRRETTQETISETVRSEDVEVEQEGVSGSRISGKGERGRPAPYQPKERSRS
jgi:uncharacterized protein (TIGR02271 family)